MSKDPAKSLLDHQRPVQGDKVSSQPHPDEWAFTGKMVGLFQHPMQGWLAVVELDRLHHFYSQDEKTFITMLVVHIDNLRRIAT